MSYIKAWDLFNINWAPTVYQALWQVLETQGEPADRVPPCSRGAQVSRSGKPRQSVADTGVTKS